MWHNIYMKSTVSKTHLQNKLTIAIYKDGKKWVSHNLTLDIVGVGTSKKNALEEMKSLTEHQLKFAIQNNMLEAINHPAPERFWKMVAEKINTQIVAELISGKANELRELLKSSPIYDLGSFSRFAKAR